MESEILKELDNFIKFTDERREELFKKIKNDIPKMPHKSKEGKQILPTFILLSHFLLLAKAIIFNYLKLVSYFIGHSFGPFPHVCVGISGFARNLKIYV